MEKQLRGLTTTQQDEGKHLTRKEEKKGSEQNHVLNKERSKRKPTRLSEERVENN